jgi:hypothetical protein
LRSNASLTRAIALLERGHEDAVRPARQQPVEIGLAHRQWQFSKILAVDDATAIESAKRLVNRYGIEVWSGVRLVVRLGPEKK